MPDLADLAQEQMEHDEAARRPAPFTLAPGVAGECDDCGDHSQRLIGGKCAPCREPAPMQRSVNGGW